MIIVQTREDLRAQAEATAECSPVPVNRAALLALINDADNAEADAERLANRLDQVHSVSADDEWVQAQHAAYHDQPGSLLGRDDCGWERCHFWDVAAWVIGPLLMTLREAEAGRHRAERKRDELQEKIDGTVQA